MRYDKRIKVLQCRIRRRPISRYLVLIGVLLFVVSAVQSFISGAVADGV